MSHGQHEPPLRRRHRVEGAPVFAFALTLALAGAGPVGQAERLHRNRVAASVGVGVRASEDERAWHQRAWQPRLVAWVADDLLVEGNDFGVDLRGLPESAPVSAILCPVLGRGGIGLLACEGLERALRLVQLEMRHAAKPAVLALLRVRQQLLSQDRRDELRRICLVELAQHERKLQVSQLPGAHFDRRSQVVPKQEECLQTSEEAGHAHLVRAL